MLPLAVARSLLVNTLAPVLVEAVLFFFDKPAKVAGEDAVAF